MFNSVEEAFAQLDKGPYEKFAKSLALYLKALLEQGFTRRESMRLVDNFAKWVYELSFETAVESTNEEFTEEFLGDEEDPEDDT